MLTPARRRGIEILDDPRADPALALRSLRDVALANRCFGGRRAVLRAVESLLEPTVRPAGSLTLLDVGTGLGDIPAAARACAARAGIALWTIGLERVPRLAHAARTRCTAALAGDALALPFADHSIDIVTCSQVLHHFDGPDADRLLQECTRVARQRVIVGDLRRSWLAAAGLWGASWVLGFHPVSRHDGVVSVLRGYTPDELRSLVVRATGHAPTITTGLGFRLSATWSPR
ncbi:MAG: methyltransferase domain-containing protein [Gemmatimonas sp.]|jgi:SAM-dependent methyltransferase|uniref:methyltransferase domain-containing protein n=1 Tax=Gemmatimonas sp. TaxID=1962908 RepID=UPI00391F4035|nr:methyltransferase domain-containing protein [Gemmatimonadota bacterium]